MLCVPLLILTGVIILQCQGKPFQDKAPSAFKEGHIFGSENGKCDVDHDIQIIQRKIRN